MFHIPYEEFEAIDIEGEEVLKNYKHKSKKDAVNQFMEELQKYGFPKDCMFSTKDGVNLDVTSTLLSTRVENGTTVLLYDDLELVKIEKNSSLCSISLNTVNLKKLPNSLILDTNIHSIVDAVFESFLSQYLLKKSKEEINSFIKKELKEAWEKTEYKDNALNIHIIKSEFLFEEKRKQFSKDITEVINKAYAFIIDKFPDKPDEEYSDFNSSLETEWANKGYRDDALEKRVLICIPILMKKVWDYRDEQTLNASYKATLDMLITFKLHIYKNIQNDEEKVALIRERLDSLLHGFNEKLKKDFIETTIPKIKDAVELHIKTAPDIAKCKKSLLALMDAVLKDHGHESNPEKKYQLQKNLKEKVENTTFLTLDEIKNASKNFIMLSLQRNQFGLFNTTASGLLIRELINKDDFKTLRNTLFTQEAPIRYRDLRSFICGSNNVSFFSSSNKANMYTLFSKNKDKLLNEEDINHFVSPKNPEA